MDTSILVEKHIDDGAKILRYLFDNKWKISVAFWNKNQFSNEWKLYLAIPILKKEGARSIYLRMTNRIMQIQPKVSLDIDDIVLIQSRDRSAIEIRNKLAHDSFLNGTTITIHIKGNDSISGEIICYNLQRIQRK